MMAVVIAAPSGGGSPFLLIAALAVAAMGLGPFASWVSVQRPVKRWVFATALGLLLWSGMVLTNRTLHVRTQPVISCDQGGWLLSWIFYGDFDCGGGGG